MKPTRTTETDQATDGAGAGNSRRSPTAAQELGAFCAALRWPDVSPELRDRTGQLTLDLIGVAIRGASEASSAAVRLAIGTQRDAEGSSAIGLATRVTPSAAALLNGTAAHAIELDDVTRGSSLHPGVTVIPAAIAVAERQGATGRALLESIVAGYEVVMRVGEALDPGATYARGFHPTGVAGAFGAAAACARLRGADGPTIGRAISIAGTMAAGSMAYLNDGAWTKRLNAGWAGHVGVIAADLALAGFTGPASALEGAFGALTAYSDAPTPEHLTEDLGRPLRISRVAIKPYACCRYNHGLIDGVLELRARHAIDIASVRRIRLGVLSAGASLVADPIEQKRHPVNPVDAQFSAPFAAAVALVHGDARPERFVEEVIEDPRIQGLMAITDCATSPALDAVYPERWPATVEIELRDGRRLLAEVPFALGEPENPLPIDGIVAKFRNLVEGALAAVEIARLEGFVLTLERRSSVATLGDALRVVRVKGA